MKVYYAAVIKQEGADAWFQSAVPFRTRRDTEDYAMRINARWNAFQAEVIEADVPLMDAERVYFNWDEWRDRVVESD